MSTRALTRRRLRRVVGTAVIASAVAATAACGGGGQASASGGGKLTTVTEQLGWLGDYEQLGEAVASAKGYYADEGIKLKIQEGGPSNDGLAIVSSGRAMIGQTSSSPAIMLARSQGEPVKAIATGLQRHPFAYISTPGKPIRTPKDMVGKTIGTQATAQILLDALLAKNNISKDKVHVKVVGSDVTPLSTGQVDAWSAWQTDQASLSKVPNYVAMPLWDTGIHLYALVYYTNDDALKNNPKLLQGWMKATAKGWSYAQQHLDEAIGDLTKLYPNTDKAAEKASAQVLFQRFFASADTEQHGWGAMDKSVWQDQLDMWQKLGQFKGSTPKLTDVMTTAVLDATASSRPDVSLTQK
jgi:NitT/TauT family transport system substrate-binding protein